MPASTAPTAFLIFGGGGDLTWRKLVPALYNLWLDGALAPQFEVIAVDAREMTTEDYLEHLREGCGTRATSRLVQVDKNTVTRYVRLAGPHAQRLHHELVAFSPADP